MSQGWFEIDTLVQQKGKTVGRLIAERTVANQYEQLTMDLEIEFRDDLGESRELPTRRHFFDFAEWRWVPFFTKKDDWI
jgi:hypothetical protein